MLALFRYFNKRLNARLSLWVLLSVTLLIVAVLFIMFRFSHMVIEKESLAKAEETLHGTTLCIDNMLYGVEVATTNMRWNVEHHLDNPNAMTFYTRELVRNNPNIVGCVIAFEPNYYKERGELFLTYSYYADEKGDRIVTNHNPMEIEPHYLSSVPYMGHNWYFIPKSADDICWVRPHAPAEKVLSETVACCMAIHDQEGRIVGVIASNIAVDWLSNTVLGTKPYPNSYCTMLGVQGTYIIHPDSTRLFHALVSDIVETQPDKRLGDLVNSMLAGESGCRAVQLDGRDSYVLYQSLNNKHWSAAIVCPESDIFYANKRMTLQTEVMVLVGLLAIFSFCFFFISQQLKPLNMLAQSAQRIADGNYDSTIPVTSRTDEIGTLQNSFSIMQQSLSKHIKRISQLSAILKERNDSLSALNAKAKETDRMKTTFIHQMADRLIVPANTINSIVRKLQQKSSSWTQKEISPLTKQMLKQTKTITDLLDQMAHTIQKKSV